MPKSDKILNQSLHRSFNPSSTRWWFFLKNIWHHVTRERLLIGCSLASNSNSRRQQPHINERSLRFMSANINRRVTWRRAPTPDCSERTNTCSGLFYVVSGNACEMALDALLGPFMVYHNEWFCTMFTLKTESGYFPLEYVIIKKNINYGWFNSVI
jgi:hypothetical protein